MDLKSPHAALLFLAQEFVARQDLAQSALLDLRPDLIASSGDIVIRPNKQQLKGKQRGRWGSHLEWNYFIHGHGCQLINRETSEPIEWDSPEISRFDLGWFIEWLEWAFDRWNIQPPKRREHLMSLKSFCSSTTTNLDDAVRSFLNFLVSEGLVTHDSNRTNAYSLPYTNLRSGT